MPKILDLERFATLSAEVSSGRPEPDVLKAHGVEPRVWEDSREEWLTKLAEETARRRTALVDRYRAAFAARDAELSAERAANPPAPAAAEPMRSAPEPVVVNPVAAPEPVVVSPVAAPEPVVASPVAAPSPVPAGSAAVGEETLGLGGQPVSARALPFEPGGPPSWPVSTPSAQPPGSAPRPEKKPAAVGEETVGLGATSPVARSPLPFAASGSGGPEAPVSAARPVAPPVSVSAPAVSAASAAAVGEETIASGAVSPVSIRALPFWSTGAPAAAPAVVASRPSVHASAPVAASVPVAASAAVAAGSVPGARLTMEQFAAMSAELSSYSDSVAHVRARWGMTEATHQAEAAAWAAAFRADPSLYGRFRAASDHYRAWGERSRGR